MWMIVTCFILTLLTVASLGIVIDKMNKLAHLVDKVLDDFRRDELQPLRRQLDDVATTISDYPELCIQVDELVEFHNEIQEKAQSYENPLEMVARKREPR